MGKQSESFLEGEADNWYARNKEKPPSIGAVGVMSMIMEHRLRPERVLEVGCGDGWMLKLLQEMYGCRVCGLEPSKEAAAVAESLHDIGSVLRGDATDITRFVGWPADLVIFGFCLYLVDREDLFEVIMGADRVLQDQGHLIIHDFYTERAYSRTYAHSPGLRSYKTDYSKLFTSNPAYRLVEQRIYGTCSVSPSSDDDRIVVSLLKKDLANAWPLLEAETVA